MEIPSSVKKSLWEAVKALLYAAIGMISAVTTGCVLAPIF